ncbi:Zinc finger PHD-type [Penicillium paradoxum]|uniref:Zinc finger PHD-type n=1 Tax=Penicillium paradoxum TaxID=176176 RepID=UPI00254730E5|nr:Zinc finger PHD-type [Penicillium paradoxum]KAJ5794941.1 Zinc finger PHD-type [Penicillium paradoxum]
MTPRRSSRARTSQPSPALLQHTNSSSSSSNSLPRERSTRSNHKNHSPHESAGHRSQSIDDAESGSKDLPHTRQRQRAHDDDDDPPREEDEDELEDDEEEVTRCLCGQQEYPGLPHSRREALGRGTIKLESGQVPTDLSDPMSDEIGSMFIQCDLCKVWQHGGCVGIMDEATSPDEYFCEECRKDLHEIKDEPHGQYSSTYLPVAPEPVPPPAAAPAPPAAPVIPVVPVIPAVEPSPAPSSRASSRETSRRSKDPKSRNSESAANAKRRSTMNSRDAAYDEEELIRRAIEESKVDNQSNADETETHLGKRSRSDSVTNREGAKRPRTTSPSPSAASKHSNLASHPPSDDEAKQKPAVNGTRRQRATSRGQLEKEPVKESNEAEPEAPEAASRRKERSNRRKGDESEHETGSPTKTAPPEPEPSQASPNTPTPQEPTPVRPSTRKSGRPPARRGRVGRNQYTKDRDTNGNGDYGYMANSPRRGHSHEVGGDSPRIGINGTHVNGGESGRPSKPRHMHPQRTTMNEMKRRVAAILEFISRMQVEMAVASENSSTPSSNSDRAQGLLLKTMVDQIDSAMPSARSDGGESGPATTDGGDGESTNHEKNFKELTSVEMMDVLTRHLLKWQQEYGKFGER